MSGHLHLNLLMHLAEKILPMQPLTFGGLPCQTGGLRAINPAQISGHRLAIFPSADVQGVGGDRGPSGAAKAPETHRVNDAGLDCSIRKGCRDGVSEALEPIHNGDEDVLNL